MAIKYTEENLKPVLIFPQLLTQLIEELML